MAKRFTDNQKWNKPFFRSLQPAYKILWLYILDECDHAGIWQIDLDVAKIKTGIANLTLEDVVKYFGDRVVVFDNNEKIFIQDFIDFQYGTLNPVNRAHASVLSLLSKYKLDKKNKGVKSPLQGDKDKDMDKDKDKDKDKVYRHFKHLKITIDEHGKLIAMGYSKEMIEEILDSIENYAKNKNYTSLYLTAIKWLKKEYPTVSPVDPCPYTETQIREAKAQKAAGFGVPEWFDLKYEHLLL